MNIKQKIVYEVIEWGISFFEDIDRKCQTKIKYPSQQQAGELRE
jgi:hypothetical protein